MWAKFNRHKYRGQLLLVLFCAALALLQHPNRAQGEITAQAVQDAIENGKKYMLRQQKADGSWGTSGQFDLGVTSLTVLALLNSGVQTDHPQMTKALQYLRKVALPQKTYEASLMIMALAAAKDGTRDKVRITELVLYLEKTQILRGEGTGAWSYGSGRSGIGSSTGDNSNSQYAVLGLRDAAEYGVEVEEETWKRVRDHWYNDQNGDGGWGYVPQSKASTGSMTVAGIATMVIVDSMLNDEEEIDEDGNPICCGAAEEDKYLKCLEKGVNWLSKNFAVGSNPRNNTWHLYYLYGLERAGRLSARRFFGEHDWYREGAEYLVAKQLFNGNWKGSGNMEGPIVATDFCLLFLSKGLAPVLVNKLKYGRRAKNGRLLDNDWDNHHNDVNNLTKLISGLDKWPKLLTWQQVDSAAATVGDLRQAPVLFISGQDGYDFTQDEIDKLKEYTNQGGTIFAEACCQGDGFENSFRDAVARMFPDGEAELKRLPPEHPVFRSEYLFKDPDAVDLWGVDLGCRTVIFFTPQDVSCLWDKWSPRPPANRSPQLSAMITKATRIGVNVIAYATGRELLQKLDQDESLVAEGREDPVTRGKLQVAKIRHTGSWNTAPSALRNLIFAINDKLGMVASTKQRDLVAVDDNIFKYPLLYMHGRHSFEFSRQEQENLRKYLDQGGFLFADACCGAPQFDKSFRELMKELYPEAKMVRLPIDHEIFSPDFGGFDIRKVKRRLPESENVDVTLKTNVHEVEPLLEAVEVDGRIVAVYSKFDISCALERQSSVACGDTCTKMP